MRLPAVSTSAFAIASLLGVSFAVANQMVKQADSGIAEMSCEASLESWFERDSWPTESVVLGDQEYGRSELANLENSRGNRVADVAIELAVAQLNIEAGAEPSLEVIEALFESDAWLVDQRAQGAERRAPTETAELVSLQRTLHRFNLWAESEATCAGLGGTRTAMK